MRSALLSTPTLTLTTHKRLPVAGKRGGARLQIEGFTFHTARIQSFDTRFKMDEEDVMSLLSKFKWDQPMNVTLTFEDEDEDDSKREIKHEEQSDDEGSLFEKDIINLNDNPLPDNKMISNSTNCTDTHKCGDIKSSFEKDADKLIENPENILREIKEESTTTNTNKLDIDSTECIVKAQNNTVIVKNIVDTDKSDMNTTKRRKLDRSTVSTDNTTNTNSMKQYKNSNQTKPPDSTQIEKDIELDCRRDTYSDSNIPNHPINNNNTDSHLNNLLKKTSENLIRTLDSYSGLLTSNSDISTRRHTLEYFFNICYSDIITKFLPEQNNPLFISKFIRDTENLSNKRYSFLQIEVLYKQMIRWANHKKEKCSDLISHIDIEQSFNNDRTSQPTQPLRSQVPLVDSTNIEQKMDSELTTKVNDVPTNSNNCVSNVLDSPPTTCIYSSGPPGMGISIHAPSSLLTNEQVLHQGSANNNNTESTLNEIVYNKNSSNQNPEHNANLDKYLGLYADQQKKHAQNSLDHCTDSASKKGYQPVPHTPIATETTIHAANLLLKELLSTEQPLINSNPQPAQAKVDNRNIQNLANRRRNSKTDQHVMEQLYASGQYFHHTQNDMMIRPPPPAYMGGQKSQAQQNKIAQIQSSIYADYMASCQKDVTNRQSLYSQPIQQDVVNRQPMYSQPIQQDAVNRRPMFNQPIQQDAVNRRPMFNQRIQQDVVNRQPMYSQPIQQDAVNRRPMFNQRSQQDVVNRQPMYSQPIQQDAVNRQPMYSQPIQQDSVNRQPMFNQRNQQDVVNRQPMYSQPIQQDSVNRQPMYSQLIQQDAVNRQPMYSQPIQQDSVNRQPMYSQPIQPLPSGRLLKQSNNTSQNILAETQSYITRPDPPDLILRHDNTFNTPSQYTQAYQAEEQYNGNMPMHNNNVMGHSNNSYRFEGNKEKQNQPEISRSLSRDSGIMSPLCTNSPDIMNNGSRQNDLEQSTTPLITHVTSLNPNASYIDAGVCSICKTNTNLKCIGCFKVYYCSYTCQKTDWPLHHPYCQKT